LSIVHFWALIFLYIWAGPHHLLYTALPNWAQSLGVVFSFMLIAPSWGGMVNGLLTLRGAWDKVRTDPVLKFFVVGITAYGMSTFEGPMMSLKNINAIAHYTDYIIAHVHLGALLWNGGLAFAMLYYIFPRIYRTKLYSVSLANWHFWLMTLGVLIYVIPLYWGGITQSLMWKQFLPDGTLQYPNFLETVTQLIPMYIMRSIGGTLYLIGACVGVYNIYKTAKSGSLLANEEVQVVNRMAEAKAATAHKEGWHRVLEGAPLKFSLLVFVAVLIGGVVEFVPTALVKSNVPTISSVAPYTPLELEGRDIYIREGCYTCHSQMIRPFRSETERYGQYSHVGEFVYDHPFQWGSKRTGPDLHRVGGKYPDAWHWKHMMEPRSTSPNSIMPSYPWMYESDLDVSHTEGKILTMQKLGVPYPDGYASQAVADLKKQAADIAANLGGTGIEGVDANKEIIAMIAYLQRLGTDIKKAPVASMGGK
ncbi:MAG: cytochrome-c oxidase, cbb3-type subunit II, partial [Ignavibacteriae bacterium]